MRHELQIAGLVAAIIILAIGQGRISNRIDRIESRRDRVEWEQIASRPSAAADGVAGIAKLDQEIDRLQERMEQIAPLQPVAADGAAIVGFRVELSNPDDVRNIYLHDGDSVTLRARLYRFGKPYYPTQRCYFSTNDLPSASPAK